MNIARRWEGCARLSTYAKRPGAKATSRQSMKKRDGLNARISGDGRKGAGDW